jgi:hypothetical protein
MKFTNMGLDNFHALSIQIVDHLIQQAEQKKETLYLLPHLEAAFEKLIDFLFNRAPVPPKTPDLKSKEVKELKKSDTEEKIVYSKFQSIVLLRYIAIFYYSLNRNDCGALNLKLAEKLFEFYSRQLKLSSQWESEKSCIIKLEQQCGVTAIASTNALLFKDEKNSSSYISFSPKIVKNLLHSSFIFMAWVKISKVEDDTLFREQTNLLSRLIIGNNQFRLCIDNGYYQLKILDKIVSAKINDKDYDHWVHLCGQYNSKKKVALIFNNAVLTGKGVDVNGLTESEDKLYLGGHPKEISYYCIQIKDVLLFKAALPTVTIVQNLEDPTLKKIDRSQMVASWRLNEGAGNKVYDDFSIMDPSLTGDILSKSNCWQQSEAPKYVPAERFSEGVSARKRKSPAPLSSVSSSSSSSSSSSLPLPPVVRSRPAYAYPSRYLSPYSPSSSPPVFPYYHHQPPLIPVMASRTSDRESDYDSYDSRPPSRRFEFTPPSSPVSPATSSQSFLRSPNSGSRERWSRQQNFSGFSQSLWY